MSLKNKKLKILFCSHEQFLPLTIGGSTGNLKIAEKMAERGHLVTVATPLYLDNIEQKEIEKKYNVKLEPFSPFHIDRYISWRELKYIIYSILYFFHIARLLFKDKYDLVFFRNCVLAGTSLPLRLFTKTPFFLSMTDFLSGFLYENKLYPKIVVDFLFLIERKIGRQFRKTFVITPNMKKELMKGNYSGENIVISYDGVDVNTFNPDKITNEEIEEAYKRIGFEDRNNFVIYHGTIQPDAVELFKQIIFYTLKQKNDIKFIIIGMGKGYDELHKQVEDPGVKFLGYIKHEEIPKYIAVSNVGIIPYRRTFNSNVILTLKILEYLSMGIPVVSTNLQTINDIFSQYNFVKISMTPEEFGKNIIKSLKIGKSQEASKLIKENFSWDNVTEIICETIEKAVIP